MFPSDQLTEILTSEIKHNAKPLAENLFSGSNWTDAKDIPRPEYLKFFRAAYVHGLKLQSGPLTPVEWRQRMLQRVGHEQFMKDVFAAFPEIDQQQFQQFVNPPKPGTGPQPRQEHGGNTY